MTLTALEAAVWEMQSKGPVRYARFATLDADKAES
jgi:hypothetical protein